MHALIKTYQYEYIDLTLYLQVYTFYVAIARAGFKKMQVIRNFCEIATRLGSDSLLQIIICKVFAFLHHIYSVYKGIN